MFKLNTLTKKYFPKKKKTCLGILILFAAFNLNAQDGAKAKQEEKYKVTVLPKGLMDIEFPVAKNNYNTLVVVTDSTGKTVFVDSQYNFAGTYKNTVDLQWSGKGNYYLKITSDNERVDKIINIK